MEDKLFDEFYDMRDAIVEAICKQKRRAFKKPFKFIKY